MNRTRPVRRPTQDANVAPAAALLADPARVAILMALMDGRALPAGELARAAGVSASTASSHLSRLIKAEWIGVEDQGRHRYMRMINPDVAGLLEALAVVGGPPVTPSIRSEMGRRSELRLARSCYDHLAGRAGVALAESLLRDGSLVEDGRLYTVSAAGQARFGRFGIDTELLAEETRRARRYLARNCLDWSERRHHIAGALGTALLEKLLELGWFERRRVSRALPADERGSAGLVEGVRGPPDLERGWWYYDSFEVVPPRPLFALTDGSRT